MDPLRRLVAIEEIRALKATYFRLMDTKQWEEFGELFTEDAGFEDRAPGNPFSARGREGIRAAFAEAMASISSVHAAYLSEITVHDARRASGIWAMQDRLRYSEATLSDDGTRRFYEEGSGHYHDEYRHDGGRWRIHRSRLDRLEFVTVHRAVPGGPPR